MLVFRLLAWLFTLWLWPWLHTLGSLLLLHPLCLQTLLLSLLLLYTLCLLCMLLLLCLHMLSALILLRTLLRLHSLLLRPFLAVLCL